ncbi:MAG: hypothetical protein IJW82_03200 [Clostridia bacterium]|nr:hypothetical protein [Clostridia bacterium]
MKSYIKALDNCNIILKILFAIPALDGIIYGLYRIFKGVVQKDALKVLLGIIWIFLGVAVIGTIIDLFSILTRGKVDILA